ncbi:hypothetical protein [Catenulispora rubra]|uniref:hypothetical protein n=1 Tax=Catenulispora rubra TaxID=280293 RepID=UPI0018928332|nr:hypothetical protein [Catenulispora rubra]
MDANTSWARLDATLQERGLAGLVRYAEPTDVEDQGADLGRCPSEEEARALLPESYRRFVAAYRCPAIEPWGLVDAEDEDTEDDDAEDEDPNERIGDAVSFFEFLPYHRMRRATGTMGHPGRLWVDVRAERERGEYRWEFVMFAAFDAAEGCGWAFWPGADESDGTDEPQVWYVEDSLPEHQVGTFAEWLEGMVAKTLTGLASIGLVDSGLVDSGLVDSAD